MKNYKTEQEEFWAGEFGTEYIKRNNSEELLASNLSFFSKAMRLLGRPKSIIEFGANIGMNLKAIKYLYPNIILGGIEINNEAFTELSKLVDADYRFKGSIFNFNSNQQYEVVLIKGVLIHINPEMLPIVYEKLYTASSKYILVCEYYNPSPVKINYRGNKDKLFKRDFAGELLEKYPKLSLIDYGFSYRGDVAFPQDDITWFLLEKK
jgi:pseudaminic acid biosynthesis-associated methylase